MINSFEKKRKFTQVLHGCRQPVSWDVRLTPINGRNPCFLLLIFWRKNRTQERLPYGEEGGDDVKSLWPLWAGLHTCYNGKNNEMQEGNLEPIFKTCQCSDWGLKLALMKVESLVIANQNVAVNLYLGLVHTARHVPEVGLVRRL